MVLGAGSTPASAAPAIGILEGQYSIDQVFPVQRTPAYPPCTDDTSYGSWTVTVNNAALSTSYPYSTATNGPVNIGSDYLAIVESGNVSAPWGIARFTPDGAEVRYTGSTWVTEPPGGWTTELAFTAAGQLYGVGTEGFMHASVPSDYGNFFSNLGVLVAGQAVTYSSLAEYNECVSSRAVADASALNTYAVPSAPISRTELTLLAPTEGELSPAYSPQTTAYTLSLPAGASAISFALTTAEVGAQVSVTVGASTSPVSGALTDVVALGQGTTVITITVEASDGSTRTYTVTVTVGSAAGSTNELAATGGSPAVIAAGMALAASLLIAGISLGRARRQQ